MRRLLTVASRLLVLSALLYLSACGNAVAPLPTPPPASAPPATLPATSPPPATVLPTATASPTVTASPTATASPTSTPAPTVPVPSLQIVAPTPGTVVQFADVVRVTSVNLQPDTQIAYRVYEQRGAQIGAGPLQPVDAATMVAPLEFNAGLGSPGRIEVVAISGSGALLTEAVVQVELARTRPAELPGFVVEAPDIVIESPMPGANLSGSFELRGSSSVMPFEGNLVYRIYDAAGTRIAEGPLQASGDYSGPAQFAATIDVPAASGTGHIEVVEINAMDGSLFAAAVVEVHFDAAAGIVLQAPPAGAAVMPGAVLRGSIATLPADARLLYRIYDPRGLEIGSGNLVFEAEQQFAGELQFTAPAGPLRVEVVATDRAGQQELAATVLQLRGARAIGGDFQALASAARPRLELAAPASGAIIGLNFDLRGSISVTPHDALLSYRVYNAAGNRVAGGPLYVPGHPGQPGTFVEPMSLQDIPSLRGPIRIELVEANPQGDRPSAGVSVDVVVAP